MSRQQWGHGYHTGKSEGEESGLRKGEYIGEQVGQMYAAEYAWHSVNAAISSLESGEGLQALMLLRALRFVLAEATGHEAPNISPGSGGEP